MAKMTMAQAIIKFLDNQYVSFDGKETKFVDGIFTVFGHGIVLGLGEALDSEKGIVVGPTGASLPVVRRRAGGCGEAQSKYTDEERLRRRRDEWSVHCSSVGWDYGRGNRLCN
jgi:TPP-dependent trihydroxycyclohexane-1,2-dione (THcHDO) dehydratase